jgi:hypothetical protein
MLQWWLEVRQANLYHLCVSSEVWTCRYNDISKTVAKMLNNVRF